MKIWSVIVTNATRTECDFPAFSGVLGSFAKEPTEKKILSLLTKETKKENLNGTWHKYSSNGEYIFRIDANNPYLKKDEDDEDEDDDFVGDEDPVFVGFLCSSELM